MPSDARGHRPAGRVATGLSRDRAGRLRVHRSEPPDRSRTGIPGVVAVRPGYSFSVTIGSTRIARRAGHHEDNTVTLASRTTAAPSTAPSNRRTPRKIDERNAVRALASTTPATAPAETSVRPRASTRRSTALADDPRAIRIA